VLIIQGREPLIGGVILGESRVAIGKMLPLIVLAFCGVFALCGAAVAAVTIYRIREGIAAARWPTATAVVKSLVVKDEPGSEGGISRHVEVAYTFMLNGVAYDGTRIHPVFIPFQATDCLTELRDKLAIGKSVRVHYDPSNPARSMLAAGFFSVSLVPLFGGLLFLGAGLGFGFMFYAFAVGHHDYASRIEVVENDGAERTGG
jgi:hypothetical protein